VDVCGCVVSLSVVCVCSVWCLVICGMCLVRRCVKNLVCV